jgi:hypothetical protein
MAVTESIFATGEIVIPMANVMFIEKNERGNEICVIMRGALHPLDAQGNYVSGYGRSDCPYLHGADKDAFLAAWCVYRREVEGLADSTEGGEKA